MGTNMFVEKFKQKVKEIDRSIWGEIPVIVDPPLYNLYTEKGLVYTGLTLDETRKKLEYASFLYWAERVL